VDIIDEGNERAELFRQSALRTKMAELSRRQPSEKALIIDGVRCCLDCEEPILLRRLELELNAVRCVECQTKRDIREKAEGGRR